ncbi:MAG: ATP-binding protein [Actinomycetota bacterium]|nr:ATP-binding protein [Actinomycetota bacterium]
MGHPRALVDLPASPSAARMARAVTSAILTGWGLPQVIDDTVLVVSELVHNAIKHAPGWESYELELVRRPNGIRVYLADGSSLRPVVLELSHDKPSGRGMRIIETLASSWGSDEYHGGKRVWLDIDTNEPDHEEAAQ